MLDLLMKLYINFLAIGSFAFGGGYAVIPLIKKYIVDNTHWLTIKELNDLISLSQITPGPIAINSATFIGVKIAGIPGGIIATMAEVTTSCILMLVLGKLIFSGRKIKAIDYILNGLKPAICGLIFVTTLDLFTSSIFKNSKLDGINNLTSIISLSNLKIVGVIGFCVGIFLLRKKDFGVIKIIAITAVIGLLSGLILR